MTAPRYYASLDGLRGYAVALVFVLHLMGAILAELFKVPESSISATSDVPGIAVMAFLAEGHHGVEIFFVLSGFLMARLAGGPEGWGVFFARRFKRIYPAFLVSLVCAATLYCLAYDWVFDVRTFALNLVFANAWPGSDVKAYNHVSWSLGYEFAFYFTLPLLTALPSTRQRQVAAAFLAVGLLLYAPPPASRMASLFAGYVLGGLTDEAIASRVRRLPIAPVLALYGGVVFAKAVAWISAATFFAILPVLLCVVVARVAFDEGMVGRFFASSPMARLGKLSYSVYLWHPIVLAVVIYELLPWTPVKLHAEGGTTFIISTSILLTLGVSAASYRWIEMPFLRHRTRATVESQAAVPGDAWHGASRSRAPTAALP